ncbi:MAG TPA: hypothetical protein VEI02_05470 [Planctomycetota bacterium]|nr:hypothetical protein [Planctomycetota bacterium]
MVRSDETAKRMEIAWESKRLPTTVKEGYGRQTLPLSTLFDQSALPADQRNPRPAMVWFVSQEPDSKLEKKLFDSENVAIASRYFDCVKIYVEDFDSDDDRKRYAKVTPTLLLIDAAGKEVAKLEGREHGPDGVYRAMLKAANAYWKKPLDQHVRDYGLFLKDFDKVAGRLSDLEAEVKEHEEHMVKHPCERAKNAIKECQEETAKLNVEKAKLQTKEADLLKPAFKVDPYARGEATSKN